MLVVLSLIGGYQSSSTSSVPFALSGNSSSRVQGVLYVFARVETVGEQRAEAFILEHELVQTRKKWRDNYFPARLNS